MKRTGMVLSAFAALALLSGCAGGGVYADGYGYDGGYGAYGYDPYPAYGVGIGVVGGGWHGGHGGSHAWHGGGHGPGGWHGGGHR